MLATFRNFLILIIWIIPTALLAQEGQSGYSRIQGVDKDPKKKTGDGVDGLTIDFREEMRLFVQRISKFSKGYQPKFIVIAEGGLDLLVKRDDIDRSRVSPARTYTRSLDGILQKSIFFTEKIADASFGSPTDIFEQEKILERLERAKKNGLKIFTLDFSKENRTIDKIEKLANARNFISSVVDAPSADIQQIPPYPKPAFRLNPKSILSLDMVKNFVTITNSAPLGHQDSFTLKMHQNNFDMIAVNILHGRLPLSRQAVETLKYKKVGTRRLVLAYMDIGSATSYHYYWKPEWRIIPPSWLSEPERDDPDRYKVKYWSPSWQQIMMGDTNSFVYGLIAQGFDGVILSGLDAYKFFDSDT